MISLRTSDGRLLYAEAFVEAGERAVGVVLYDSAAQPIATLRLNENTVEEAIESCVEWMIEYDLDDDSGDALIKMVTEELVTLEAIRRHGPDITQDWLGTSASRRLPEL